MASLSEWIEITKNKIELKDICIDSKWIGFLEKNDDYSGWLIEEEDNKNYGLSDSNGENGIRFHCVYININKNSPDHGKLFRLTSFLSGDVDFAPETYYFTDYKHQCT